MDESRWRRLRELFEAAQRLAPEEREAFLDEACAGEPEIRREVESLLRTAPRSRDLGDGVSDSIHTICSRAGSSRSRQPCLGSRLKGILAPVR